MGHLTPLYDTLAGPKAKQQARVAINAMLSDGNTAFDYAPGYQVSAGGLLVDAWQNAIGAFPQLSPNPGARPIWLPFTGIKYASFFAANGNGFSTPDAAANNFATSRECVARVQFSLLVSPNVGTIIDKLNAAATAGFAFATENGTGKLFYAHYTAGALQVAVSTVTIAAAGIALAIWYWVKVSHNTATGAVNFSFAPDATNPPPAASYTAIGAAVASVAGATTMDASALGIGLRNSTGTLGFNGKIAQAALINGIGGTLSQSFNAEDWPETMTNGATAASSQTGEIYTLTSAGNLRTQIIGSPVAVFDGVTQSLRAVSAFNNPKTVYLFGNSPTWTNNDIIMDGGALNTMNISQVGATPNVSQYSGGYANANANFVLGQYNTLTTGWTNSIADFTRVGLGAAVTGQNAGAGVAAGATFGANAANGGPGNLQMKEAIGRTVTDTLAFQNQLITLMAIANAG